MTETDNQQDTGEVDVEDYLHNLYTEIDRNPPRTFDLEKGEDGVWRPHNIKILEDGGIWLR